MKLLVLIITVLSFIGVQAQSNKYVNDSLAFGAQVVIANQIPTELKYENEIKFALKWIDKKGENYFIATIGEDKTPYAKKGTLIRNIYLYTINPFFKTDKVWDNQETAWCINGAVLDFITNSVYVTDLDNDSIAEVTFVLSSYCEKDTLPITQPNLTLSIIEYKDVHIIGGFSLLDGNKNLTLENICCYQDFNIGHGGLGSVHPTVAKKAQGMFNKLPFRMPRDFNYHVKKAWLNAVKSEFEER